MLDEQVFITGSLSDPAGPLGRFLPPIPNGVCTSWLEKFVPPGSWIVDPFGASPRSVVEAARAGYRVLVASNNPIDRFLIELAANPPGEYELRSSLADLGATMKGEQRLEPHLRALYGTTCNHCHSKISADAYLWDRDADTPHSRVYHCPVCGESGEFPINTEDETHLPQLPAWTLHRARALERVAPKDDPDRSYVEEALDVYLPRSLYALFTLVNKLDSLPVNQRRPITALLLAAFDQANVLWPEPSQRNRPKILVVPSHFRENNVWLALEEAIETWTVAYPSPKQPLPVTIWPQLPPASGGICLFEGRLKDLADTWQDQIGPGKLSSDLEIMAVIAPLPRPNQAYWTLSALWAGWLWGHDAAASFKTVLRRRRYDWTWHAAALHSAFTNLLRIISPKTPIFGLIGECEAGFINAALLAGSKAGLKLSGIALRQEHEQAQIHWHPQSNYATQTVEGSGELLSQLLAIYQKAGQEYLRLRGEPTSYLQLHTAALAGVVQSKVFQTAALVRKDLSEDAEHSEEASPAEFFTQLSANFQTAFSYRSGFVRFHGSQKSLDVGQWWLRETSGLSYEPGEETSMPGKIVATNEIVEPLSDRVEMEIVRLLLKTPNLSIAQIDQAQAAIFPGLYTPDYSLVESCCESYTEPVPEAETLLRIRPQDTPKNRRADLDSISDLLINLGRRLGYSATRKGVDSRWICWQDPQENLKYAFYPAVSARLGNLLLQDEFPARCCLLVYPGSRAGLIRYKLRNDARLQSFADQGWRFLKFRHVRFLVENELLTQENLDEQLALDPMASQDTQMTFL